MASSIDKRAQIYVTYNFADKYPNNPKLIIHSFQFRITDESSKFFSNQSKQLFRKKNDSRNSHNFTYYLRGELKKYLRSSIAGCRSKNTEQFDHVLKKVKFLFRKDSFVHGMGKKFLRTLIILTMASIDLN